MAPWTLVFGKNENGQAGLGHTDLIDKMFLIPDFCDIPLAQICARKSHSMALNTNGKVYFWGSTNCGIGGPINDSINYSSPQHILPNLENIVHISSGDDHCAVLNDDGAVFTWGTQIDDDDSLIYKENYEKVRVADGIKFCTVECGSHFTVVIDVDGVIWTWGENRFGQLGLGHTDNKIVPQKVDIEHKFSAIACGSRHVLALAQNGNLYSWGRNDEAQLGYKTKRNSKKRYFPKKIKKFTAENEKVIGISCGYNHSLAWTDLGNLYCWGDNKCSQLGFDCELSFKEEEEEEDTSICFEPKKVENIGKVVLAAAGIRFTNAISDSGILYQWGENYDSPTKIDYSEPIFLESLRLKPTQISCGAFHTIIHAGPKSKPMLYPSLPAIYKDAIVHLIHTKPNSQVALGSLKNEYDVLKVYVRRLAFEREWNRMKMEGAKIAESSLRAEQDPLGTAKLRSTQVIAGISFGIAFESTRTRVRNSQKGKAGIIHYATEDVSEKEL